MVDVSPFANRLAKNFKHLSKWARRLPTDAWRVYDKDIPQFPFAVDIYGARVHLQEYDTGWQMEEAEYQLWMDAVLDAIAGITGCARSGIAIKTRRRQKGLDQYEKVSQFGSNFVVSEQGHKFWVNLDDYLDTGLFLDHRNTRRRVQEEAAGKRMLNLFAYTGSFTVYAAAGGAIASETVDLSNTYLDWSRRNFSLNGMDTEQHQLIRDDVFQYLEDAAYHGKAFDLIVMDPPSFSNSKKMMEVLDIQRDQARLVDGAMRLLKPDGVLYFSNNLRSFTLDPALAARYRIRDISAASVAEDFRNKKIHQCWQVRHQEV